jgi:hypothetical protein
MKELAKQLEAIRDQQQQQQSEQQQAQILEQQPQQQRADWQPSVPAITCNFELQQQQGRVQQLNCGSQQQHHGSGHQDSPTWQGLAQ